MSDEQRHSEEERETEREETVQDLDVSKEEGEDVKGGLSRNYSKIKID